MHLRCLKDFLVVISIPIPAFGKYSKVEYLVHGPMEGPVKVITRLAGI